MMSCDNMIESCLQYIGNNLPYGNCIHTESPGTFSSWSLFTLRVFTAIQVSANQSTMTQSGREDWSGMCWKLTAVLRADWLVDQWEACTEEVRPASCACVYLVEERVRPPQQHPGRTQYLSIGLCIVVPSQPLYTLYCQITHDNTFYVLSSVCGTVSYNIPIIFIRTHISLLHIHLPTLFLFLSQILN